jgi:hypothetical protein
MVRLGFPKNQPWTPLERVLWLLSVVLIILATVLLLTGRSASWVVLTVSLLVVALGVVRYRADEANADDHGE